MQLLSPLQLHSAKTKERKMEVDEGIKLARRVDKLREVISEEELRLHRFRTGTVAVVNQEIESLKAEIPVLKEEIATLLAEKSIAMRPIQDEWKEIHLARSELQNDQEVFSKKVSEFSITEAEHIAERVLLDKEIEHIESVKTETDLLNKEATKFHKKCTDELRHVTLERENFSRQHEEAMRIATEKERRADYDREHYKDFMESLRKKERELNLKERRLNIREHATSKSKN